MKKVYFVLTAIVVCCVISICLDFSNAIGADWRVYTEVGGMNVFENNVDEGHKSYHLFGTEVSLENMRAKALFGMEGFFMGEPPEEDPEIPCAGAAAFVEYSYKIRNWIHPYLGIRYDHISRGTAPKYENPNDPEYVDNPQVESEHDMVSARGGIHMQKGIFWADIGTIIPFYTNTKSGNFGPDVGIGFTLWDNVDIGYRYKEIRLTDHHLKGAVDLSFYWSGVQIGYTF